MIVCSAFCAFRDNCFLSYFSSMSLSCLFSSVFFTASGSCIPPHSEQLPPKIGIWQHHCATSLWKLLLLFCSKMSHIITAGASAVFNFCLLPVYKRGWRYRLYRSFNKCPKQLGIRKRETYDEWPSCYDFCTQAKSVTLLGVHAPLGLLGLGQYKCKEASQASLT